MTPPCPCPTCDCWDADGRCRLAASVPGCPACPGDVVVVVEEEPSQPVRAFFERKGSQPNV